MRVVQQTVVPTSLQWNSMQPLKLVWWRTILQHEDMSINVLLFFKSNYKALCII